MKAISLWQPYASLLVTRQPCDCVFDGDDFEDPLGAHHPLCNTRQMVKRFETRSWPFPPALIGQPIAIHATKKPGGVLTDPFVNGLHFGEGSRYYNRRDFPLGAIVGSGRITASYPILDSDRSGARGDYISDYPQEGRFAAGLWQIGPTVGTPTCIEDQRPYGDFTPGRYAWLIEDAAPTTERCPWCWGEGGFYDEHTTMSLDMMPDLEIEGIDCPVCGGERRCEPIPARGKQRIWNWEP